MNCNDARELLLTADTPGEIPSLPAEVRAHLAGCAACREYVAGLGRLEATARGLAALPAGLAAEASAAKERFHERLKYNLAAAQGRQAASRRHALWRRAAVAAMLLVAVGLSSWMLVGHNESAQAAEAVVEQLVDLNTELAQTSDLGARAKIHARLAPHLHHWLVTHKLAPAQKELAAKLLEQSDWLAQHSDPRAEAGRFNDLAGLALRNHNEKAAARIKLLLERREIREQMNAYRKQHPAASDEPRP